MGGYPLKDRKNLKKLTREQTAQNKETIVGSGAPTTDDDSTNPEITVGTLWIDSVSGALYVCTDDSVGSAEWVSASGSTPARWIYGGPSTLVTVSVVNGLSIELGAGGAPGTTVISAADFMPVVKAPTEITPAFGITVQGAGKPTMFEDPEDAYLTVNCDDVGMVIIWVWVEESGDAQSVYSETYVLVQDDGGACAGP